MRFDFTKMHGLGNDFVIIDARATPITMTGALAQGIAQRATGIGCDQLIVLEPSDVADVHMRIWNADGSVAEACGNATRCVAKLLGGSARIETAGGLLSASTQGGLVAVTMPAPRFRSQDIPLAYPMDTVDMPVAWEELDRPAAVNVGNPHIVFFVDDIDAIDLARLGPVIEADPLFPERVNVNVAMVTGDTSIRLRVWERGAGLTRACGTGAVATAVVAINSRRVASPVTVSLPGGDILVDWSGAGAITMQGSATETFRGSADTADFV
jgi:diaminopimelate epimerase